MGYATSTVGHRALRRRARYTVAAAATLVALAMLAPTGASAWAPPDRATIHPGVMTVTKGAQCTANFVFRDGSNVYLGQTAHCSSTSPATETDGCKTDMLPLGTRVRIEGASRLGTLVYNSSNTMQARREKRRNLCLYNDFGLVRIARADRSRINPSVPGFGGPAGVGGAGLGASVYSYGNSELRLGAEPLSPKQGYVIDRFGGGWNRLVYMVTPGIPGDSGSGFLNRSGEAIGLLTTIIVTPTPAANDVTDLGKALAYMRNHSRFSSVRLVRGTEPFDPSLVDAMLGG